MAAPVTEKVTIVVDSRDRDIVVHPNSHTYVVNMDNPINNIVSVELVYAMYYTIGIEPYVNLNIPEISDGFIVSTNDAIARSFTQLPLVDPLNKYTSDVYRSFCKFKRPLSKLNRLSVGFTGRDGNSYDVGDNILRLEVVFQRYDHVVEFNAMGVPVW
jgi:hypothetical protein